MKMTNKLTNLIALFLLILMAVFAFLSVKNDSATMDEQAHIGAGYSYISQKDMRLNPEHPPLLKDLAGLAAWLGSKITAQPINFPSNIEAWQTEVNSQWSFGADFLYRSGNDADKIIFWSRIPMILLGLLLGFYVFKWTRELYGRRAGLLALLFFVFSPTFLAHTRYVTTDVGAAAAFFIATYYLIKWLKDQSKKNLIIAGLVFGLAMLTKFSLALLIPYFVFLVAVWALVKAPKEILKKMASLFLIGLIALVLIWPVYLYHTWNYPALRQQADTTYHFQGVNKARGAIDALIWASDKPVLRPYAQYTLGLIMVMRRAAGGNTAYFLGQVNNVSWWYYFPMVYFLKVPLSFHLLTIITLLYMAWQIKEPFWKKPFKRLLAWIKNHFTEFACLSFLAIYWIVSIRSNLNIGVRHVLPTFPFMYLLVSGQLAQWIKIPWSQLKKSNYLMEKIKIVFVVSLKTYFKYLLLFVLVAWYLVTSIQTYPYYLAFFNQSIGGSANGYKYVTDSNLDWGQDLKRLTQWVDDNNLDYIYLNYFGGGLPEYYLKEKFRPGWDLVKHPQDFKKGDYLAISATILQEGRAQPAPGFNQRTDHYFWLDQHNLVTTIGYSIFVYQIQ